MEYKHLKFEVKALTENGEFEGYAAVKGNVDAYGDIIQDGAFKRTIRNKKQFPILFMHDPTRPVGISKVLKEDSKGLYTKGQLDLNTELGRTVYSGLKLGYIDSMSIGYKVVQDEIDKRNRRLLKEIKLLEYSLITKGFAANELATVSGFKSTHQYDDLNKRIQALEEKIIEGVDPPMDMERLMDRLEDLEEEMKYMKDLMADPPQSTRPLNMPQDPSEDTLEEKSVSGNLNLPIASADHEWNGPEAKKRIFEWAGGVDFDPAKARQGFFWYDSSQPTERGSYKLPFADVINGRLTAIPRALSAVLGALEGARGTGVDIPESDKEKVRARVNAYKKRMGEEPKADSELLAIIHDFRDYLKGV